MRSMLCILSIAGVLTSVAPVHAQSTASGQPLFEDRAEAYHAFMLGRSLEGAGDIDHTNRDRIPLSTSTLHRTSDTVFWYRPSSYTARFCWSY